MGSNLYAQPGLLMFWSHECLAPWQTQEWVEQMRKQLRPNAFLRHVENRFVTSESNFVPIEWFDACVDPELSPELTDPRLSCWCGVDASVKRDSTAIVCSTFDQAAKKVRLVWHRTFQPSPEDPLDFENTIERTLLELKRRFWLREVRYDPYQMQASAQRLTAQGVPMLEFPQSVPNLTEASTNLYEIIKGRNLITYPDDDLRLAISRSVALETTRGWRIAKEKASHKIDVVVALAQACLGAVQQGQVNAGVDHDFQQRAAAGFRALAEARRSGPVNWGPQILAGTAIPEGSARLSARGGDIARIEDRISMAARRRWGAWWCF